MTILDQIINLLHPGSKVMIYDYNADTTEPLYSGIVRDVPTDLLDCEVVALRSILDNNAAILEIELNVLSDVVYY